MRSILCDVYVIVEPGFAKCDVFTEAENRGLVLVIKIGMCSTGTKNPSDFKTRLKGYQTHSPEVYRCCLLRNVPKHVEADLQYIFSSHTYWGFDPNTLMKKKRGEFFYYEKDIITTVKDIEKLGPDKRMDLILDLVELKTFSESCKKCPGIVQSDWWKTYSKDTLKEYRTRLDKYIDLLEPRSKIIPNFLDELKKMKYNCEEVIGGD